MFPSVLSFKASTMAHSYAQYQTINAKKSSTIFPLGNSWRTVFNFSKPGHPYIKFEVEFHVDLYPLIQVSGSWLLVVYL